MTAQEKPFTLADAIYVLERECEYDDDGSYFVTVTEEDGKLVVELEASPDITTEGLIQRFVFTGVEEEVSG